MAQWWGVGGRDLNPRPGSGCVTTLGKLFTPVCLDADSRINMIYYASWQHKLTVYIVHSSSALKS